MERAEPASELAVQFDRLRDHLAGSEPPIQFRPGRPSAEVHETLKSQGIQHPGQLAEWFELQDGVVGDSSRITAFFGMTMPPLDGVVSTWQGFLKMTAEIESDDDLDYQSLDYWPKPGWFPITDWTDGYFIVDTDRAKSPGRVVRCFADDLEVWAESLASFVRRGVDALEAGETEPTN